MKKSTTTTLGFAGAGSTAAGDALPATVDFGRMALVMLTLAMGSSTLATFYGLAVTMGVR